jgi:hypothetical protein
MPDGCREALGIVKLRSVLFPFLIGRPILCQLTVNSKTGTLLKSQ